MPSSHLPGFRTVVAGAPLAALCLALLPAAPASAHFRLLQPVSWLKEDNMGAPQKGGPCGPGGYDNVSPVPVSDAITEFTAGQTITVQWIDTVAHPGYFRIALAENRADLLDPTIAQGADCDFTPPITIPSGAHGNVLADGVHYRPADGFNAAAGVTFTQTVTLPDQPCEKCTLQVLQVMESDVQALSNCHYYHCADIKIVAKSTAPETDGGGAPVGGGGAEDAGGADGGSAGGGGGIVFYTDAATDSDGTGGGDGDTSGESGFDAGGTATAGTTGGSSGCSLTQGQATGVPSYWLALGLGLLGAGLARRRRSSLTRSDLRSRKLPFRPSAD